MKTKTKKKTAKKKAAKSKKPAAKKKAMKAKSAAKPKSKMNKVKAKTKKPAKKKSGGLTVQDLFRMKQESEQAAQNPDWQHKKDLPAQDQHSPEDAKDHGSRKSGFGGIRHH